MGILGNISPNYPWVTLPGGITAMVYVGVYRRDTLP